ncbi:RbsD/FucU domain-containing protein [Amnibacterium flavum]|uniref:RbsD or FucU transport n=1 Tax=Amnibacterium flavum TaxID=2173173 RepID=A0A2V1HR74_9MICO|nr:RbsD/FucU domain-containing protein [Amnibacterium flavum]PVZ93470.1 RbsD or FucU transport [Amnibacterium flavum]
MLRLTLTNPPLLSALSSAGHGSKVLFTDANYPATTAANPRARLIELSIGRNLPTVSDLLGLVLPILPVEAACVMEGPGEIPAHDEYAKALAPLQLDSLGRFEFYDAARGSEVAVVVTTGDTRLYANLMLTVGVA